MSEEDYKILKHNHGEKSLRVPFVICVDIESLLEKISTCYNSPEKSSTTKIKIYTPSGYSLFAYCSFDGEQNNFSLNIGKNCLKNFQQK